MVLCLRHLSVNTEEVNDFLMTVIRFVAAAKDHKLQKMVQLFGECLYCASLSKKSGQPAEEEDCSAETILMSQIVPNELLSANQYLRGSSLRNLARSCNK